MNHLRLPLRRPSNWHLSRKPFLLIFLFFPPPPPLDLGNRSYAASPWQSRITVQHGHGDLEGRRRALQEISAGEWGITEIDCSSKDDKWHLYPSNRCQLIFLARVPFSAERRQDPDTQATAGGARSAEGRRAVGLAASALANERNVKSIRNQSR